MTLTPGEIGIYAARNEGKPADAGHLREQVASLIQQMHGLGLPISAIKDGIAEDINAMGLGEDDEDRFECQNCGDTFSEDQLNPLVDVEKRVLPGEIMPFGECPACGAACHKA